MVTLVLPPRGIVTYGLMNDDDGTSLEYIANNIHDVKLQQRGFHDSDLYHWLSIVLGVGRFQERPRVGFVTLLDSGLY